MTASSRVFGISIHEVKTDAFVPLAGQQKLVFFLLRNIFLKIIPHPPNKSIKKFIYF